MLNIRVIHQSEPLAGLLSAQGAEFLHKVWSEACVIKDDGKVDARKAEIGGSQFFIKCYQFKSIISAILYRLGGHKYNKMLAAANAMAAADVRVPKLYCVVFDWSASCLYTINAYEAGGRDLRYLIGSTLNEEFKKANLAEKLASLLAGLHMTAGVLHGDFKWANILYDHVGQDVLLVDIDGARKQRVNSSNFYRDVARFVIDCEEAGLAAELTDLVVSLYANKVGRTVDEVKAGMSRYYAKIKSRHNKSYGEGFMLANPQVDSGGFQSKPGKRS
ncbi:hypothetical protein [Oceanicoccus sp. KOV_DT_Chl]|uniref:hypothetical protein n=1 Tax=Oceanicoccus sp. KOV_DT_Chl TaxID=1904639 RepID=UPI000C7C6475|nr:hypothetical protein [Oceanicoccus sp. KOV_DT_Chl]